MLVFLFSLFFFIGGLQHRPKWRESESHPSVGVLACCSGLCTSTVFLVCIDFSL